MKKIALAVSAAALVALSACAEEPAEDTTVVESETVEPMATEPMMTEEPMATDPMATESPMAEETTTTEPADEETAAPAM